MWRRSKCSSSISSLLLSTSLHCFSTTWSEQTDFNITKVSSMWRNQNYWEIESFRVVCASTCCSLLCSFLWSRPLNWPHWPPVLRMEAILSTACLIIVKVRIFWMKKTTPCTSDKLWLVYAWVPGGLNLFEFQPNFQPCDRVLRLPHFHLDQTKSKTAWLFHL